MNAIRQFFLCSGLIVIGGILGYLAGKIEENLQYEDVIALDQGVNAIEAVEILDLLQKGKYLSVEGFYKRQLINSLNRYHHLVGVDCDEPLNNSVYRYIRSLDYVDGDSTAGE